MRNNNRKDFLSKELELNMKNILENDSVEGIKEVPQVVFKYLMKL